MTGRATIRWGLGILVGGGIIAALVGRQLVGRLGQPAGVRAGKDRPGRGAARYRAASVDAMGTKVQLLVAEGRARQARREVFAIFRQVEARMSEWKHSSPLSAVNRAAGERPVAVPADLRAVVRRGIEIGRKTGGAFDITWAALWGLWDFKAERPTVPAAAEIRRRVGLVDYRQVVLDERGGTVALRKRGMKLGLGAIGKGYALDRAAERLRALGIDSFMIVAGGQVVVGGRRGDRPWRVGIRDPRGPATDYFAKVALTDSGVSTSGDYERYFVIDGLRYHHILDPRTGRPARSGLRSVSVICADATLADALSTAFMVMGRTRGLALVDRWPGVEVVMVDDHGKVHTSEGVGSRLHIRHPPHITERNEP